MLTLLNCISKNCSFQFFLKLRRSIFRKNVEFYEHDQSLIVSPISKKGEKSYSSARDLFMILNKIKPLASHGCHSYENISPCPFP